MRASGLLLAFIVTLFLAAPAYAQNADMTMPNLPPLDAKAMDNEAPINLSPDGPAVIKLNEDAASVIIGNPAHATAMLENPRLIMLMPAQPGATKIMALDKQGKAIFSRHVLVGGTKAGFLRINRICGTAGGETCKPVSMYYCPDKCYETAIQTATPTGTAAGDTSNPAPDAPAAPAPENPAADAIDETTSVSQ